MPDSARFRPLRDWWGQPQAERVDGGAAGRERRLSGVRAAPHPPAGRRHGLARRPCNPERRIGSLAAASRWLQEEPASAPKLRILCPRSTTTGVDCDLYEAAARLRATTVVKTNHYVTTGSFEHYVGAREHLTNYERTELLQVRCLPPSTSSSSTTCSYSSSSSSSSPSPPPPSTP